MIRISTHDVSFLDGLKPPVEIHELLHRIEFRGDLITREDADLLIDFCGDCLGRIGFDSDDEPTPAGLYLEGLVDRMLRR